MQETEVKITEELRLLKAENEILKNNVRDLQEALQNAYKRISALTTKSKL